MSDLTSEEIKVLGAMSLRGYDDYYLPFNQIAVDTGLSRNEVAVACRTLRARGLAQYAYGLWNEDEDKPAGSGYSCTRAGYLIGREHQP